MTAREILERPFPAELIRHRPGNNGQDVTYLEGHVIIARLNEAFGGDWSFVIEKHEVLADEVIVLGRMSAGTIVKCAFGSSAITRTRDGGKPVSIGDDLKAASMDSLKKASTWLGVGLTLHANGTDRPAPAATSETKAQTNGNGHLSQAQLRAVHAIRRRLGWDDAQLAEFAQRVVQVSDVEKLDKRAASTLIEKLQLEANPVGATR